LHAAGFTVEGGEQQQTYASCQPDSHQVPSHVEYDFQER
jgi:hypothetical protein